MAFVLIRDGKTMLRYLEGPTVLGEVLNDDEHDQVKKGNLAAFTESGGLMSLSSPLKQGQTIYLRPLQPEKDLQGFGFPINRARETVGISELLAIRKYEENYKTELYNLSLAEIRERLQADPLSEEFLIRERIRKSPENIRKQVFSLLGIVSSSLDSRRRPDTKPAPSSNEPTKRASSAPASNYPKTVRPSFCIHV